MEEVLACRLCLSTDVKLLDMFEYRLINAYEDLTGIEIRHGEGLQRACSMCSSLLLKSLSFQQMCRDSVDLLKFAESQKHLITTDYIRSLKLSSPYSNIKIQHNNETIDYIHNENQEVKKETCWDTWDDDYVKGNDSDTSNDEPLSAKVKPENKQNNSNKNVKKENKNNNVKLKGVKRQLTAIKVNGNNEKDYSYLNDFKKGEVDVIVLTKEQQLEEIQARKKSSNYLQSMYKCDQCFKGFISNTTYKNHMVRHDPSSGPYKCDVCSTRWMHKGDLKSHRVTAHERKYACRLCDHVSKSRPAAKEHSKWHEGHLFVCKFCGVSFSKSSSHLSHIRIHHPSKHVCDLCGASFIGEFGLTMHKKKAHRNFENVDCKTERSCSECNLTFHNAGALQRHLGAGNSCDGTKSWCVHCGEGFSSDEELKEHVKLHSKVEESIKCLKCDRTFLNKRSFSMHSARVHGTPPARTVRLRRVKRERNVVCEVCGKKCLSNALLRYHQRTHTGEKPHQCNLCPKSFGIFQQLQIHHRIHTGERPYKCDHCPKAFKIKTALTRHERVHTGAKPYECSQCGRAFSQSNSLKGHIRAVHLKMASPYRPRRKHASTKATVEVLMDLDD